MLGFLLEVWHNSENRISQCSLLVNAPSLAVYPLLLPSHSLTGHAVIFWYPTIFNSSHLKFLFGETHPKSPVYKRGSCFPLRLWLELTKMLLWMLGLGTKCCILFTLIDMDCVLHDSQTMNLIEAEMMKSHPLCISLSLPHSMGFDFIMTWGDIPASWHFPSLFLEHFSLD